jgi:hypothetical protein
MHANIDRYDDFVATIVSGISEEREQWKARVVEYRELIERIPGVIVIGATDHAFGDTRHAHVLRMLVPQHRLTMLPGDITVALQFERTVGILSDENGPMPIEMIWRHQTGRHIAIIDVT